MSFKSEIHKLSFRLRMLAIFIVTIGIWWPHADTSAQETPFAASTYPFASNSMTPPLDAFSSVNSTEIEKSGPIVLSRLFKPASGIGIRRDFHAQHSIQGETFQSSPQDAGAKAYRLFHGKSASGFLLDVDQMNHFSTTPSSANRGSSADQMEHYPVPLVQLKFGGREIPIVLSDGASSR
jgi:hypothetical protein